MNDAEPQPLRAVIGAAVRRLRVTGGQTQDDIARAAWLVGLSWDRPRIAALERGDKAVSADELVLLPLVLGMALDRRVSVRDLFDSNDEVSLMGGLQMPARDVGAALHGEDVEFHLSPTARGRDDLRAVRERLRPIARRLTALGLDITNQDLTDAEWTAGEAEGKAARKLQEDRLVVLAVAVALWGRSLTAERDTRLAAELPEDAEPRTVQARRGHITRQLLSEIADRLQR